MRAEQGTAAPDAAALQADAAAPRSRTNRRLTVQLRADGARLTGRIAAVGGRAESLATPKVEQRVLAERTAALLDPADAAARSKLSADVKRL